MIDKQTIFLVVDDIESMRRFTSNLLRSMGAITVLTAKNGIVALSLLKNHRVDLVLSNWNMPVMSGLELLKSLRADENLSHLPFIMITADVERSSVEEAIANGVSELLVRPFTMERLASRIGKALVSKPWSGLPIVASVLSLEELTLVVQKPQRLTILVVDDIPDHLQLLFNLLKDEYRVRIALSGEKALNICQSDNPPDLVLLDIMMPDIDGFEVARCMREHPISVTIPVIFVTAMTGNDAHLKGLELGAVDFLSKPVDPELLRLRIRNFMRYIRLHKQLQDNYDNMLEIARLRLHVEHIHDTTGFKVAQSGLVQELMESGSGLRMIEEVNLSSTLLALDDPRFMLNSEPPQLEKSWKNSLLISASEHLNLEHPLTEISLAQLKSGMKIESVSFDDHIYIKNCTVSQKIIDTIYSRKENTGKNPIITIRLME